MTVISVSSLRWQTGRARVVNAWTGLAILFAAFLSFSAERVAAQTSRHITLVALGDSLTAGYGLPRNSAFPAVLEQALRARGHDVTVINAGVNGDTASGGYYRVDSSVPNGADGVILELGANDMLRNVDPSQTRNALAGIILRLKRRGIPVLLAGMRALPSKRPDYVSRFESIYPGLARSHGVSYYPFFLNGVVFMGGLNQADGVHPNAAGVQTIVQSMLPSVERFIARIGGAPAARPRVRRERTAAAEFPANRPKMPAALAA